MQARRIGGFFLRLLVIFVVLIVLWPGLKKAYGSFFQAGGNVLFTRFGSEGRVHFGPLTPVAPDGDTEVTLRNRRTQADSTYVVDSRTLGYKPTVFMLALILATPIPWPRRLWAVLWGFLLINVYVALRVGVFLLTVFSGNDNLALFSPGPTARSVLDYLYWILVGSFAGLLLPLPIWVVVSFRRRDWERALRKTDDGESVSVDCGR